MAVGAGLAAAIAAAALGGCAGGKAEDEQGAQRPRFRLAPEGMQPERITITVEPFQDRNRDGWPDSIPVTAYLFAPSRSAQPYAFEGGFEFVLTDLDSEPLAEWRIAPEQAPQALQSHNTLTGYRFGLGVPAPEEPVRFPRQTMLAARFTPVQGRPVTASVVIPFGAN